MEYLYFVAKDWMVNMATSEAQENASLSISYRLMGIFMRGSNQDHRGNMTIEGFEIREYNQWLCVCIYIHTYTYTVYYIIQGWLRKTWARTIYHMYQRVAVIPAGPETETSQHCPLAVPLPRRYLAILYR